VFTAGLRLVNLQSPQRDIHKQNPGRREIVMTDTFNPIGHSDFDFGRLGLRKAPAIEDVTAARLFAAVEQGIDELVRAAGREPKGALRS
jgi:hypothetical protein